jgi:D-inositol-3-phosphate glycosyltransferase
MRYLHSSGLDLDFVHANYWLSGIAAHRVKHQFKIPLITTFHTLERAKLAHGTGFGSFSKLRIHQEQRILGCSDAVLVSGGEEARWLRDLYGAEPSKLVVVPLGIDRAYFSPGDCAFAKQALGIDDRTRLIVYVGRIQPLKGTYLAVEALSKLEPDTRLVIVGGPSGVEGDAEMRKIKKLIASEHLKGRVDFVHPQPHELLATYYRAADVCVVPSESETFGLVALESSACGTPVVATDVGGLRSIVEPGHTGILVNERSADAFAKAIRFVLDNPIRARAMGKLASRRADRFTWRESALRLVTALEGLEESADLTHGFSCA